MGCLGYTTLVGCGVLRWILMVVVMVVLGGSILRESRLLGLIHECVAIGSFLIEHTIALEGVFQGKRGKVVVRD